MINMYVCMNSLRKKRSPFRLYPLEQLNEITSSTNDWFPVKLENPLGIELGTGHSANQANQFGFRRKRPISSFHGKNGAEKHAYSPQQTTKLKNDKKLVEYLSCCRILDTPNFQCYCMKRSQCRRTLVYRWYCMLYWPEVHFFSTKSSNTDIPLNREASHRT